MFVHRVITRIKKRLFIRTFQYCDKSAGLGYDGAGKGCFFSGKEFISVGKESYVGNGSELIAVPKHFEQKLSPCLFIGNHVRMTARCRITCAGTITIGDDVLMAPDVFITDHNHGMDPTKDGGYSPQPLIVHDVTIKQGVWLGQRAGVLPGVTIGEHSIIGANSVVTKDIPPYCIAAGSPARVIKTWNDQDKEWKPISH